MSLASRRHFLQAGVLGWGAIAIPATAEEKPISSSSSAVPLPETIPGILPRDATGRRFVLYSDCCSGVPGGPFEATLAQVNAVVSRLRPRPEFIAFPGDAVAGYTTDPAELRRQWRYWTETEMRWLRELGIPLYQSTSNHHTYDLDSESVYREVHQHLPQNGTGEERGLAYAVRNGNLVYLSTHQPDRTRPYRREMALNVEWLDAMLTEHADARFKLVAGHYPVWPINGYALAPQWCLRADERDRFWQVLVKHRVDAYVASHVIAFDMQVHEGIPQIVSAGAGTVYGAGGGMPGDTEGLHATEVVLDDGGLRYRIFDTRGKVREQAQWPPPQPGPQDWHRPEPSELSGSLAPQRCSQHFVAWRFTGILPAAPIDDEQTLLCGFDVQEGPPTVWIGFESGSRQLSVRLLPQPGTGPQSWRGPHLARGDTFDLTVALHPGLGPGGVLWRLADQAPWNSLTSQGSRGAERLAWPGLWGLGGALNGPADSPFRGDQLSLQIAVRPLPEVS
jgi:hypothetical protein